MRMRGSVTRRQCQVPEVLQVLKPVDISDRFPSEKSGVPARHSILVGSTLPEAQRRIIHFFTSHPLQAKTRTAQIVGLTLLFPHSALAREAGLPLRVGLRRRLIGLLLRCPLGLLLSDHLLQPRHQARFLCLCRGHRCRGLPLDLPVGV